MPKRKANDLGDGVSVDEPRRSSRRISTPKETPEVKPATAAKKAKKSKKVEKEGEAETNGDIKEKESEETKPAKPTKPLKKAAATQKKDEEAPSGRQYWLMKAEPESRLEKGKDIKFSIDDLAAKTEPEPWDGIRAYSARNNLRAMKKGDLAFFYHSSCKVPAIVGIMEIVEEHTPDLSAHDPSAPYYDAKSTPESPKWSVVHVVFKQKLETPVTLKELKTWQQTKGNPLEEMQMLKLARISVSKVREDEWRFLVDQIKERGDVVEG